MLGRVAILMAAGLAMMAASAAAGDGASAQRRPRIPRQTYSEEPGYWVGLSYGYLDGMTIEDRSTASISQFGYSSQIRATLEKTIQRGVTIGASAGFSTATLNYSSAQPVPFGSPCPGSCDGNADITQALAFVHGGGGLGFHGMYSLEGGFTEFSNFREQTTGQRFGSSMYNFTFGLGGGLGFGISPTTEIYVGEQFDFVLDSPLEGSTATRAPRSLAFRVGGRFGF